MTTQASLNETMQRESEFIHFEDRASDHPFVDKVRNRWGNNRPSHLEPDPVIHAVLASSDRLLP